MNAGNEFTAGGESKRQAEIMRRLFRESRLRPLALKRKGESITEDMCAILLREADSGDVIAISEVLKILRKGGE